LKLVDVFQNKNGYSPYLVSIKTLKIIATEVSWIPDPSMLGNEGPEETP
jgi:hypothetical protein